MSDHLRVLKSFNSVNRRFKEGQELSAADLAELDVEALKQRGCIGKKEPDPPAAKLYGKRHGDAAD